MITDVGFIRYCEYIYKAAPIYTWGADGEVITKELIDTLKKKFPNGDYSNIDLSKHEGKMGMDCSGAYTKLSGMNITSRMYYDKCIKKGPVSEMNMDIPQLVFRGNSPKTIGHVGAYLGDGRVFEMYNDCELHEFKKSKWNYYGIPDWIEYTKKKETGFPDVPFIIKLKEKDLPLYATPSYATITRFLPDINKYTIVEVKNGFGKFKSGAGWFDLNRSYTYEICK